MSDRFILLMMKADNGESLYTVVDRTKIFNSEREARKEMRRLNELDDSIIRAFDMAREDKKRKEGEV